MAKKERRLGGGGFVVILSSETAQKLAEGEQAKAAESVPDATDKPAVESSSSSKVILNESKTDKPGSNKANFTEPNDNNVAKQDIHAGPSETEASPEVAWGAYAPYITYDGDEPIYTDPSTQQKYNWNKSSNAWELKPGQEGTGATAVDRNYSYEDDTHVYTEPDGAKFFWDVSKKAWIPKVDDDFLAFYQMSYGFVDNSSVSSEAKEPEKKEDTKESKQKVDGGAVKRKTEPQWFQPDEETNTKVYVSNLPEDLTEEEFVNLMQKCGLVEREPSTQKMKVKLYMDKEQNCFKGDALCTYIKIESVQLALDLLDGSELRGNRIKVERASFQLKGDYNPALKPKKKKKKELEKIKKMQQKLFDWRPEKMMGEKAKHEKVVIVKNLFHPSDFDKEVQLILDYQQDLREECGKSGQVRKVVIYDRHPEGVAQITMKEPEEADAVVQLINGRWFGKRQITAEIWDGRTKYRIGETDADLNKRIDKWDKFLEEAEDGKPVTGGITGDTSGITAPEGSGVAVTEPSDVAFSEHSSTPPVEKEVAT